MRLRFFIFIFSTFNLLYAQEISDIDLDSINSGLNYAYGLNHKSRYGKSILAIQNLLPKITNSNNYNLLGSAYNSLSYSYTEIGEKEKAFKYAFLARDYFIKAKDTSKLVLIYSNIGTIYRDFNKIDESNKCFKKALDIDKKYSKITPTVYPNYNIGSNLIRHDVEYAKALSFFQEAIKNAELLNFSKEKSIYGDIYCAMSYAYFKLGDTKKSDYYYNKAHEIANSNKYLYIKKQLYLERANLYKSVGNYKDAYNILQKHNIIKDSINKINNNELTITIAEKYKIKENEKDLKFLKKEQAIQNAQLKKSKFYMTLFGLLIVMLFITIYLIVKKNNQLQIAKDKAENLTKVKSNFYSEISHELRTPLYAVIEISNLLLKENVSPQHKEYIESLKFSGDHLMALINNVLELNRVESGKLKIQQIDFNLKNLVSNIINSLEYALMDSKNSIDFKYDDTIPNSITGDSLKVSQILINLISNAIKFTNNGHIKIEVKKLKQLDNKVNLYFKVSDNGLGISKEKQSQVFENFYQENTTNAKAYKGTGLGLSIVERLLKNLGSKINVSSKLNEGSDFYFELEFSLNEKDNLPIAAYNSQLEFIKGSIFLIVDDNKINQLVTAKVLDHLEIKSKIVSSGAEAIEIIKEENFNCILMDLHMPELDGYETTKLIREFNNTIPIVALTAATKEEVEIKTNMYGMDGYILKPFFTKDFVEAITKAMHRNLY